MNAEIAKITSEIVQRSREAAAAPRQLAALERVLAQRECDPEMVEAYMLVKEGRIPATSAQVAQMIQTALTYPYRVVADEQPSLVDALHAYQAQRAAHEEIAAEDAAHMGDGEPATA